MLRPRQVSFPREIVGERIRDSESDNKINKTTYTRFRWLNKSSSPLLFPRVIESGTHPPFPPLSRFHSNNKN